MVDCGATGGEAFIDDSFARDYNFALNQLPYPRTLHVVDGRTSSAGAVTHTATFELDLDGHKEQLTAFVTKLGQYNLILGMPWLRKHDPHIDWQDDYLTFNKNRCREHCLRQGTHQLRVNGMKRTTQTPKLSPQKTMNTKDSSHKHGTNGPGEIPRPNQVGRQPRRIGAAAFHTTARQAGVVTFSASIAEIDQCLRMHGIDLRPLDTSDNPSTMKAEDIRKQPVPDEDDLGARQLYASEMLIAGVSLDDIRIALEDKKYIDPATKLPRHYHHHLPAFDRENADLLPPHRDCDHKIELKPGTTPPYGPLYNMSVEELQVLRKYLKEQLGKGWIRTSKSPAAAPVLFAKKPGGGLRFCVDYRALNAITIKNRYPLPLIQETLSKLNKAKIYTKLDIIAAFNHIRIAEGDEWMTAFNTRYGLFETLVMPFGLSNAPATFQTRINQVLRPFLDIFCTAYIDDILIYSDNLGEHRQHVDAVLQALKDAGLHLDIKKCEFEVTEVVYLGLIITPNGVRMDPQKVSCITGWQEPHDVKDVQGFLGFSNFYRRFIKNFSRIVKPLVQLTKKDHKWNFDSSCKKAFKTLQDAFTKAPTLAHFDPELEVYVETDASDWVSAGVLSQMGPDGILRPVAFMSKKYDPAECNYEIYDKELLAIVRCFEGWRAELQGTAHPIRVLTDHRNLEYFMTTKQLSRRQVRWAEFLSQFDFAIRFRPGKQGGKPDLLTRRSQDIPSSNTDERVTYMNQTLLNKKNVSPEVRATLPHLNFENDLSLAPAELRAPSPVPEPSDHRISRLLEEGYKSDKDGNKIDAWWNKIYEEMTKSSGTPHSKEISLSECEIRGDKLYYRDRLYVPGNMADETTSFRTFLLQTAHDSVESGHPGSNKLYALVARNYFWPRLSADTSQFVRNCHNCHRNNNSRLKYQGALKPLPIPEQRWKHISLDLIGPLPISENYNAVMVVIDRLSKMRHFVACHTTMTSLDLANLFVKDIWRLHGLPDDIISDRGPTFVSELWRAVNHRLGTNVSLSTAFHQETDGQSEQANAYLEQYLRKYIDFSQEDWSKWLPLAEFAANNAVNSSIEMTPFFANYGFHPRLSFGPPKPFEEGASPRVRNENLQGTKFTNKMEAILDVLHSNLAKAKANQERFANAKRSPAPAYRIGDMVYLDARNIKSIRPSDKLSEKMLGPFPIISQVNSHTYELELPFEHEKKHNCFHVNLLRPSPSDPLPGQTNAPAPPVMIDDQGEKLWAVDRILNSRRQNKVFKYHVLWRDQSRSWEPLMNVVNSYGSTHQFHHDFPKKAKPTREEITAARAALQARLEE